MRVVEKVSKLIYVVVSASKVKIAKRVEGLLTSLVEVIFTASLARHRNTSFFSLELPRDESSGLAFDERR